MTLNVDQRLVKMCQRDQIIAVRDQARREAAKGDKEAVFVLNWMEDLLRQIATEGRADVTTSE